MTQLHEVDASGASVHQQLWQSDQVVSCNRKREHRFGLCTPSHLDLSEPGLCLDPAEHLLNPLAQDLAYPIPGMPGGASIDGRLSDHAVFADPAINGDVGRHFALAQGGTVRITYQEVALRSREPVGRARSVLPSPSSPR